MCRPPEVLPVAADPGAEVRVRPQPRAVTPRVVVPVRHLAHVHAGVLQGDRLSEEGNHANIYLQIDCSLLTWSVICLV